MTERVRLLVSGRVQGVWYRASAQRKARELGVTGWARNLPDDRVEILAAGERVKLTAFVNWCREGSPEAIVAGVETDWHPGGAFPDFEIK